MLMSLKQNGRFLLGRTDRPGVRRPLPQQTGHRHIGPGSTTGKCSCVLDLFARVPRKELLRRPLLHSLVLFVSESNRESTA